MHMLTAYGILYDSEYPVKCEPCSEPGCHHQWKPDIVLTQRPITIEIHRPQNDADAQAARKRCLENSGFIVLPIDDQTARDFPEILLPKIMRLEELARVTLQ
jgi:hypothetical protein